MKQKFLLVCFFFFIFPSLWAERYALVIGNSDYKNIQTLNTPVNDASDIAAALTGLGYIVDLRLNIGIDEMEEAIYHYTGLLARQADNEGFFWYAGHGVQADNENFLLPVDINALTINQVKRSSYSLNDLMLELEYARNRVNVVILDACRNNPLPAETRSYTRGLAAAPVIQDTFIMFSTAAGATADDGQPGARNSPFTTAFLMHISSMDVLESVAKEISRETIALTNSNQRPYISDNILYVKNYSLNPAAGAVAVIPVPSPSPASAAAPPASIPAAVQPGTVQPEINTVKQPEGFIMDGTTVWALTVSYENTFRNQHNSHGGTLNYTFLERFKNRGSFFFVPNVYFLNFRMGTNTMKGKTADFGYMDFTPGIGVMWKFRPDAAQRMFAGAGFSANVFMGNLDYSYNDGLNDNTAAEFLTEPMVGIHGNFAFRFSPLVALELNAGFYFNVMGDYYLRDRSRNSLHSWQTALGVSMTFPYGSKK